jgi:hypothetical protein
MTDLQLTLPAAYANGGSGGGQPFGDQTPDLR